MAKWKGFYLDLNGLTFLSKEAATGLAKWGGWVISLKGIPSLSEETVAELAKFNGSLYTNRTLEQLLAQYKKR